MRFLILMALLALVTVAAADRLGGPKAQQQPKPLQAAAPAAGSVNGTLPALNGTTAGTTAAGTTEASTTEATTTTEASTTVASKVAKA